MTSAEVVSEPATAVLDVLIATAERDNHGRVVSSETLYRFLMERFGLNDADARRLRTAAMSELRGAGLVRRLGTRGPRVQVLPADVAGPASDQPGRAAAYTYEEYAAAIDGDLDMAVSAGRRVEQGFLRRVLLAGQAVAPCAFCGRVLPAALLVAAHLKRRADLDRQQRLRFRQIAVLACSLGCDALYEAGYISVGPDMVIVAADATEPDLAGHLSSLAGRLFPSAEEGQRPLLREHHLSRFRGAPRVD